MKNILILLTILILNSCNINNSKIYEFEVENNKHEKISLADYKGKVLLIVNTASRCGFTPQYTELETMYKELKDKGFEILDFPCNQFGQQAPESDEEYVQFCQLYYKTEFPQFHKIDVNGENEIPLYTYLKSQKTFVDFDPKHNLTPILVDIFDKNMPGWRETSDIKWNFTKFLIDRNGNVVERFEPTATIETMLPKIKELL